MKPIMFNTDMARALQEERKTVTRRKPFQMPSDYNKVKGLYRDDKTRLCAVFQCSKDLTTQAVYAPYQPGDILWVRETWQFIPCIDCRAYTHKGCVETPITYEDRDSVGEGCFIYRANYPELERVCWRPSIHMPKQAARLFLRVTGVRVERLQDIDLAGCRAEGIWDDYKTYSEKYHEALATRAYPKVFGELWNSTIKPADLSRYGWEANPWVWVIEFERISKEAALGGGGDG